MPKACIFLCGFPAFVLSNGSTLTLFVSGVIEELYSEESVTVNQAYRLLLFDLDRTLLQRDKTISKRTLSSLKQCREKGILIGVSTSRSEQNSLVYLNKLMPDILISSGGALVKYGTEYIYKAEFSTTETKSMIDMA